MPSPCQNDGICSETTNDTSDNYYCECTELYMGQRCNIERIDDTSIPESSQSNTVAIAVGVTVAVVAVVILITSAVYLFRRRRKADANINARNSSLHESEDSSGDRVREHNYGYVVNAAFDQDEPQSTYL